MDNEYMAIAREFTRLIGGEWHEWDGKDGGTLYCICGKNLVVRGSNLECKLSNPTWDNPAKISNAIKTVKCGDCDGSGEVERECMYIDSMDCRFLDARDKINPICYDYNSDCITKVSCPTCSGTGTINFWDRFVEWHIEQCTVKVSYRAPNSFGGYSCTITDICPHTNAEIILTPKLLMQSYISFARGRE